MQNLPRKRWTNRSSSNNWLKNYGKTIFFQLFLGKLLLFAESVPIALNWAEQNFPRFSEKVSEKALRAQTNCWQITKKALKEKIC